MLELEAFSVELTSPLETAAGTIDHREGFLVTVEYDGRQGVGEATPLPGWTESRSECRTALSRAAEIAEELDWGIALAKTDQPAARHGLALALADARARAVEEPLYRYFGDDRFVPSVPVNATIGDKPSAETVESAAAAVDEGFDCLKIKVGARSVDEDVERLQAVRERVGDGVELRADANGAWSVEQADHAFDALADVGVSYVEQPLPAANLEGHARLRGGAVDVALDESLTEYAVAEILAASATDVLVVKPMVVGGPDRAREIALTAREAGVDPVVSTTVDAVVGRTGAVHLAASLPDVRASGLATASLLADDLSADPAPVTDGAIEVPQGKGLGLPDRPTE
ncbi:o-succinylbenzoate synthase [Salinibaculum rarum]|uniref:o-succinylbenzoate synthase n=1 Tax=Salinibaculum rarum TaxID=3058903 RepID=UPI00265FE505|nr:o-succinylbenzoate synthase [Salinibaculum sp. KK48]